MQEKLHYIFVHPFYLLLDIFLRFPIRGSRFFKHFLKLKIYILQPVLHGVPLRFSVRVLLWLGECGLLILDLLGLPEWYEIGNCWVKTSRTLSKEELLMAEDIFGDTLPYYRIRLDERAYLGPRQYHFCYVSFCVINSWKKMPPAILIHELVHVWQFRHFGSPYLLRALLAQRTIAGYDYGGWQALLRARDQAGGLSTFNYEQQASIIEDFFRLRQHGCARWASAGIELHLEIYRYFVDSLQNAKYKL